MAMESTGQTLTKISVSKECFAEFRHRVPRSKPCKTGQLTGLPGFGLHFLFPAALARLGNHGVHSANLPGHRIKQRSAGTAQLSIVRPRKTQDGGDLHCPNRHIEQSPSETCAGSVCAIGWIAS